MPPRRRQRESARRGRSEREPPPDAEAVFRAMYLTSKRLPQYFAKKFGTVDLRLTEFAVLRQLWESGPTPMARLGDENSVTKAAVTAIIDAMEAKGLVRRIRDSKDRRVVKIQMTPAGRKLYVAASQRHQAIVAGLVALLEPDEVRVLIRTYEKLYRFVEKQGL